jgi:hypothetical protein
MQTVTSWVMRGQFRDFAKNEFLNGAAPFLIACAMAHNHTTVSTTLTRCLLYFTKRQTCRGTETREVRRTARTTFGFRTFARKIPEFKPWWEDRNYGAAFRERQSVRSINGMKYRQRLKAAKRRLRFPKWQVISHGGLLPQIPDLFDLLGGDSWTAYRFLTQHHPKLEGNTALSALLRGKVQKVPRCR